MKLNFTKIAGWVLLCVGVIIISYALYASHSIFTDKKPAPEIFPMAGEKEKQVIPSQKQGIQGMQSEIKELIGEQIKEILPADLLPKLLNLFIWSMFAWILIFGGVQISNLGIKLLKT